MGKPSILFITTDEQHLDTVYSPSLPYELPGLRGLMARRGIDAYIIPTSDFHESEYVGDYFKARKYMSGFTGSAGTMVVTAKEACLWTDGRYFIQAEKQRTKAGAQKRARKTQALPDAQPENAR